MRYRLFVRWGKNQEGHVATDSNTVELALDGQVVQQYNAGENADRINGYCKGVVDTLTRLGIEIQMPSCLTGRHLCANRSRED